jgi:protein SCO1/2
MLRSPHLAAAAVAALALHGGTASAGDDFTTAAPPAVAAIDVEEHLGAQVPLDLRFRDHDGREVTLGELVRGDVPVILTFNYSSCPMLCSLQLDGVVDGLGAVDLAVGESFRVVTIVIEPKEEPARANDTREAYLDKLQTRNPTRRGAAQRGGWTFLVAAQHGDDAAIRRLADTVGFRYRYVDERAEWAHPAALVMLSPNGIVTRYVHGIQYDPKELFTSLVRAGTAEPSASVGFVQRCFHYDPNAGGNPAAGRALMKFGALAFAGLVLGVLLVAHLVRRPGVTRS